MPVWGEKQREGMRPPVLPVDQGRAFDRVGALSPKVPSSLSTLSSVTRAPFHPFALPHQDASDAEHGPAAILELSLHVPDSGGNQARGQKVRRAGRQECLS